MGIIALIVVGILAALIPYWDQARMIITMIDFT